MKIAQLNTRPLPAEKRRIYKRMSENIKAMVEKITTIARYPII